MVVHTRFVIAVVKRKGHKGTASLSDTSKWTAPPTTFVGDAMARRKAATIYSVMDGYGDVTYDLTRSQARDIVRQWRREGHTSRRGDPSWKSNETEIRRMVRIPSLRKRPQLISELAGYYGKDANVQLRTLLAMGELAAIAGDRRTEDMVARAYEMTIEYWAGNVSLEEYNAYMKRLYATLVAKGYWDPSDSRRNSDNWRYFPGD